MGFKLQDISKENSLLLPKQPHSMANSKAFFAAVKAKNYKKVKKMLEKERHLIYQYDSVELKIYF